MATTTQTNPFTLPCVDEQTYTAHATGGTYRITLIRGEAIPLHSLGIILGKT